MNKLNDTHKALAGIIMLLVGVLLGAVFYSFSADGQSAGAAEEFPTYLAQ